MASSGPSEGRAAPGPLLAAFLDKRENLVLFLAARGRSMAAAEDLVKDLYLKVAAMPADASVHSPTALLYRMASNLLVDHVRSDQRASRRDAQWRLDTSVTFGSLDVVSEPAAVGRRPRSSAAWPVFPPRNAWRLARAWPLPKLAATIWGNT